MPVSVELVIEYYEQRQHEAYAKDCGAIVCGQGEADGNENPSKRNSVFYAYLSGRYGTGRLVLPVFFRVDYLIGNIKLQEVQPDPKNDVGET